MNRIVHISLKVDNVKKTGDFYRSGKLREASWKKYVLDQAGVKVVR